MEKVNARRGFLKGFGVGAAVIGGFASVSAANAASVVGGSVPVGGGESGRVTEAGDISHLAPREGIPTFQIQGDNRPPPPPQPVQSWSAFNVPDDLSTYTVTSVGGSYISSPSISYGSPCPSNEMNNVSMAVGKDDRLWIKVGDTWKRVVVEG